MLIEGPRASPWRRSDRSQRTILANELPSYYAELTSPQRPWSRCFEVTLMRRNRRHILFTVWLASGCMRVDATESTPHLRWRVKRVTPPYS